MLSQDVAATLLLLDQALEKGFEGDVIINGLAEHFRNLLLCKDARMAKLLDVPNDHRPMYNEKAMQTPPSFILSALNVINDSELQYKTATNKRLHVEMCLIRLCFLLQSIPATNDEVKKKPDNVVTQIGNNAKPVADILPTPPVKPAQPVNNSVEYPANNVVEKVVQEAAPKPAQPTQPLPAKPTIPRDPSAKKLTMNMLQDLDVEVAKAAANVDKEQKILTVEKAEQLFSAYKKKLQDESKSVLYSQFIMMRIEVLPPDELKLISPSELTDTYARDQRSLLTDFYRAETGMIVRITTAIIEDESIKAAQNTVVLSKSEMYEAMARKNPNLAALKDTLGMQIEY